eukprot:gene10287-11346_t
MDTYRKLNIKDVTRCHANTGPHGAHTEPLQKMPQGYSWGKLFYGSDNKNDPMKLIFEYLRSPEGKVRISLSVTFHAITDCDTTSYFYGVQKIRTLMLIQNLLLIIQNLWIVAVNSKSLKGESA